MFGNMGDMMGMMGKMKDLQARMKEAQEQLGGITESAESGAGLVRVTVNGQKKVVGLEIDKDLIKPEDKEMLRICWLRPSTKLWKTLSLKLRSTFRINRRPAAQHPGHGSREFNEVKTSCSSTLTLLTTAHYFRLYCRIFFDETSSHCHSEL